MFQKLINRYVLLFYQKTYFFTFLPIHQYINGLYKVFSLPAERAERFERAEPAGRLTTFQKFDIMGPVQYKNRNKNNLNFNLKINFKTNLKINLKISIKNSINFNTTFNAKLNTKITSTLNQNSTHTYTS